MPIFMKIQGITGESTVAGHEGEIEVQALAWGVTNPSSATSGSGGSTGRASLEDVRVETAFSKASPNLLLACATGRRFSSVVLTFTTGGSSPFQYLKITLSDCLFTSYESAASTDAANSVPSDDVAITFSAIDVLYTVQSTGETVEVSFQPAA